jgi:CheY-like chemotaxis protein
MKPAVKQSFPHFIVVDDDACTLLLTRKLIQNFSRAAKVVTFSAARGAIEYMETKGQKNKDTDTILLTDLHMPEMDGFGLLDRLESTYKAMKGRLHIFVLSGEACPMEIKRVLSYIYVVGFMVKPMSNVKMAQVIHSVRYPL